MTRRFVALCLFFLAVPAFAQKRVVLIDVAPTIADWAGWRLPQPDGLALSGLFEKREEE